MLGLKFLKSKFSVSAMAIVAMLSVMASNAFAAETADQATVDSMTSAFGNVKATGLAALGAIATIAIVMFAGVYAWKYGKKVFSIIAK